MIKLVIYVSVTLPFMSFAAFLLFGKYWTTGCRSKSVIRMKHVARDFYRDKNKCKLQVQISWCEWRVRGTFAMVV